MPDLLLDLLLLLAYLSTRPLKWLTHPQRLKHHHLFLSVDPFLDVVPFPLLHRHPSPFQQGCRPLRQPCRVARHRAFVVTADTMHQ